MRPDRLALILSGVLALPAAADTVEPISRYDWATESIAGLSGLEIDAQGRAFTAIGDRGFWMAGRLLRDGATLTGIEVEHITPLLGNDGHPVAARRVGDWADAEGLAIEPDGTTWVSFERWDRVALYRDGLSEISSFVEEHETFAEHAENWQLEAAATAPDGTLYVFSEKPLIEGFPIYRLAPEGWVIDGYLPERDLFAIVGADFDTNGDLYILERKLVMGLWWQSQIRRVNFETEEDITLWTSERGDYGNLEGIAVWRDGSDVILTTVSDNNNEKDEPTQFVEFRLVEAADSPLDEAEPEG